MSRPVAVITGVGRPVGIGAGIARTLIADGWDLAVSYWTGYDDRVNGGAAGLDALFEEFGDRAIAVPVDLERTDAASTLMGAVNERLGTVSALVLSHAEGVDSSILTTTVESFDRHFAVNTRASWLLIAEFARQIGPDGGAIVALTSDHTTHNMPYGASKGALDRIVISAAKELGHLGIRSNALNPGPVDTGWMTEEVRASGIARQPTGRLGTPTDVADMVSFLVGPRGKWVTGQLLYADGGFAAKY
ncbi:SDR family oxidoreductase [Marisediminicola senii]|uniref:SDR family oxidoreductase n=1 Tax=Marisediminicola senii TaxID=2711233 RepID=UPI0013ED994D|nr:SDR family oxidoreductase [Marisediminicola senii]